MATRTKAADGEGPVRRFTYPDGTPGFRAQLTVNGKRGSHRSHSQREVLDWVEDFKKEAKKGTLPPTRAKKLTVPEVVEAYIDYCIDVDRAATTVRNYRLYQRLYIKPLLDVRVENLDSAMMRQLARDVQGAQQHGNSKGGKRSALLTFSAVKAALNWAASEEGKFIIRPSTVGKMKYKGGVIGKKNTALPVGHLERLFEASSGLPSYLVWRLLFETGARSCEALGWNVGDVDFANRQIDIEKIATPESYGRDVDDRIKDGQARYIELSDGMLVALEQVTSGRDPEEPLFPGPRGGRLGVASFNNWWRRDLKAAGIPHYKPHQLRHTFATYALRAGVDVMKVSQMLGHSSPAITLNVYAHVLEGRKGDVANAVVSGIANLVANSVANAPKTRLSIVKNPRNDAA